MMCQAVWFDQLKLQTEKLTQSTTFRAATGLPQHRLRGQRGADGVDRGGDKTRRVKCRRFRRSVAGSAPWTGLGAGMELRTGVRDQGRTLEDRPR